LRAERAGDGTPRMSGLLIPSYAIGKQTPREALSCEPRRESSPSQAEPEQVEEL